ncbi:unnamed protein product [Cyclocybe aegerita]|uniref:Uncharacterized protein n=1 Tax=Cyclocybe aegerita TaxID=1973307 RepID=A0A8S0VTF9_CYCAE|nr:unnamed protein product [Cyclocybe aegerita]
MSSTSFSAYKRPSYKSRQHPGDINPKRPTLVREPSENLLSYYESSIPNESPNYARSSTPEKTPSRPIHHHTRKISTTSTSSSDYSDESETTDAQDAGSETSASVTRRSNTPSKGAADRRRVAIVEMDTVHEGTQKSHSGVASNPGSLRSRRGHNSSLAGLALVAPPDAALRTYTQLTPPSTAPATGDYDGDSLVTVHQDRGHHRSASENTATKTASSRDTGTVGTSQGALSSTVAERSRTRGKDKNNNNAPPSFAFQRTTASRSPSPTRSALAQGRALLSPPDSVYPPMSTIDMFSPIVTPDIGEGKEIHIPVAAPVVVDLESAQSQKALSSSMSSRSESPAFRGAGMSYGSPVSLSSSLTSAYLRYQPGLHATAGPLPPPPRATFSIDVSTPPPPRPPRLHSPSPARIRGDLDAVKQALQLPPSVSAVLASRTPKLDETKKALDSQPPLTETSDPVSETRSIHRREGAMLSASVDTASIGSGSSAPRASSPMPSTSRSSEDSTPSKDHVSVEQQSSTSDDASPSVTVVEPPPRSQNDSPEKFDHSKFDQWLADNPQLTQPLEGKRSLSFEEPARGSLERPLSPLSYESTSEAPSPPPKSLRNSLTSNFKRFSALPKASSISSRSARCSSGGTRYSSRTPSPVRHKSPQRTPFQKIKSTDPAALFCHEVNTQTTTLQRCAIYASKINELYLYDCGLTEWLAETKYRTQNNTQAPRAPSSTHFSPQPRHTSRSSMISEATFPRRPDASTATDLSQGAYRDITPPSAPPPLPYPSLALNPPRSNPTRSNSSVGSGTPPSSIRSLAPSLSTSSKGTGFFASLGRKASLSKRDRLPPISSPSGLSPGKHTSKNSPSTMTISRPINITSPPTVPGGPRAPPRRVQRSQTFMTSFSPPSSVARDRDDTLGRRPSMFNLTLDSVIDIQPDPEFVKQVDKLAALLPHADREVLAGYLRRAGQDMLAIGQYLEDEKNGTLWS